ncbi:MAG: RimK family alpha-L-glutamate ligase [Clostridia bacterium]|nr:RimK family alpha-L-glutamate ligase [Clostridia bacterium]
MKTGWLVVNHFLQTNKFTDLYDRLKKGAKQAGLSLLVKTGCDLLNEISSGFLKEQEKPDFVLFWDKDVRLAKALENMGIRVYNSAKAIEICDDKSLTHQSLAGVVPMPKTVIAPMTYESVGYTDLSFVETVGEALGYPMIIKECFGSFGAQVYLVHTLEEAKEKVKSLAGTPFLFQKFIAPSSGRDIRLQVVGEKVIAAMLRYSETGDFRAGITSGGSMKPYEPTKEQRELAVLVCKTLGLDFAGVDFLFGENDEPILCEVNSNAHFKNLYDCTGVDAAAAIMEHIADKLEGRA